MEAFKRWMVLPKYDGDYSPISRELWENERDALVIAAMLNSEPTVLTRCKPFRVLPVEVRPMEKEGERYGA